MCWQASEVPLKSPCEPRINFAQASSRSLTLSKQEKKADEFWQSSLGEIQTASYAPEGETAPSPSKTLSKSIKKRQEAIETFLQSGRQDLAAQYKDEVSILSSFVAQQTTLTSEQIDQLVQSTFAKLQLDKNDKQAMGKLIKAARDATPDVDGKALAASVKRFLTGP